MRSVFLLLLLATPALAQGWQLRAGDRALTIDEIDAHIVGHTLVFFDDGQAKFSVGGAYSYTYDGGGSSFGSFRVGPDGVI